VGDRLKAKHLYGFGSYRLDAVERVLLRDGQPVTLPPKDLETLLVLVERAGHIVEKEELLEKVWPGVFVEEGNLARHIFNLRQVLGDSPDGRKYIETIPKRGYRFVAAVQEDPEATAPYSTVQDSEQAQTTVHFGQKRSLWMWPLALAVLAVTGILIARHFWPQRNPSPQRAMLAVLPFINLSGDAHEDYFADGLTEEMIAQLGQLQPAQLGVIARTSTARYKDTKETVAQIARELGVGYLLEGSVRRGGDRVRVTAQLIQAGEQTHLWAETYERPLKDVLSIQREIAEKITHSLSIQLLPAATSVSANSRLNLESYDKYLLGLHELGEDTRESVNRAIQYFQEAIALDPKDARLYAALAAAYDAATTYYSSPAEVMPRAKEAALRAVELDPTLGSAHVRLGYVRLFFDWDWPAAEREYRRALEINPSLPEAQLGYANYLATLGHFDEAVSRVQQAYLFDPLALESRKEALWIYYFSGRMPETVEQAQKTIELEPDAGLPHAMLAMAYAQMGKRPETLQAAENAIRLANSPSIITATAAALAHVGQNREAKQLLSKALEQAKQRYVCRFLVADAYVELGDTEKALESLEQGFLQRST
jgi:TolB-like protein/DNA-binding winged helix-turn-helix (wHTH) protein/cytochrome c-type biogenesis protein CcmH/NrfG